MIKHKAKYLKAIAQWLVICSLIPLSIYVDKRIWNLFWVYTVVTAGGSFLVIVAHLGLEFAYPTGDGKKKDNTQKRKEKQFELFCKPLYKKGGVDKIEAEREQFLTDKAFHMGIIITLIFLGHTFMGFIWITGLIARAIMQTGLIEFDEKFIEEL